MLKKTIKYTDYNGLEREEDFYFNLSKSELSMMQLSVDGGLSNLLNKMIQEVDIVRISQMVEKIILKAYGEKSDDGKRFVKSKEMSEAFSQTAAYDVLFMDLMGDASAAANFVNECLPKDVAEAVKEEELKNANWTGSAVE